MIWIITKLPFSTPINRGLLRRASQTKMNFLPILLFSPFVAFENPLFWNSILLLFKFTGSVEAEVLFSSLLFVVSWETCHYTCSTREGDEFILKILCWTQVSIFSAIYFHYNVHAKMYDVYVFNILLIQYMLIMFVLYCQYYILVITHYSVIIHTIFVHDTMLLILI